MMKATLDVELFRRIGPGGTVPKWERQRSQEALLMYLEGLAFGNVRQLELAVQQKVHHVLENGVYVAYPGPFPPLYVSGIRYMREDGAEPFKKGTELEGKPTELWQDVYTNFERKTGDCEDLATHRVAELRVYFKREAAPFVTFRKVDGNFHYHVLVMVRDDAGRWRLEDPSRKLGMGWEDRFAAMGLKQRLKVGADMDKVQAEVSPAKLAKLRQTFQGIQVPRLTADLH